MAHARSEMVLRRRAILLLCASFWCGPGVLAQDLVPGAYAPVPINVNIVNIAATINKGDLSFDPALPIDDGRATIGWTAFGYVRTLGLGGRYANVSVGAPFVVGHLEGMVRGQFQETSRAGLGDLAVRVGINLYGVPAMTPQQFANYRPTTILGVSVSVGAPVGEYDSSRFINIGTNRWAVKPEVGFSRRRGQLTFEGTFGAAFFTEDPDFVGGPRTQAPIAAAQGHLIYTIRPGTWVAADGNYWRGGRITTNGTPQVDEQNNSRVGFTVAVPLARHQIRIAYSFGAFTNIGGDFQSVGASYSYAWVGRP